jgi:NitT/TauT family transport system substrate-binding protein
MLCKMLKPLAVAGMVALAAFAASPSQAQKGGDDKVHVALADLPEMETLFFLVGLARAGKRGLKYDLTFFAGEDLAIQTILAGQLHIGLGSPYAVIQNVDTPVRMFQQVSRIVFFPVVAAKYKTWKDMNGVSIAFHSRGGPLEPLAAIVAKREGITLGKPQYIPGSENRVVALQRGHVDAAIVDLLNKDMIMKQSPDKFRVLPWVSEKEVVTDEALFARLDWLQKNEDKVQILVEEMLKAAQEICANPGMIADERKKYDLLEDLPEKLASRVAEYYEQAIKAGVYSCTGGSPEAARNDIAILQKAGQLKGSEKDLSVENFWYFEPLQKAKATLGIKN